MPMPLRQSTAIDGRIGPFVDVGDGFTPETGVTIGASDEAEILKANGAATVTMAGVFAAVSGCDGWYDYTFSTSDTDVVGELVVVMQDDSVYLPVFMRFVVLEEAAYDALYAAAAPGPNTVVPMTAALSQTEHDATQTDISNLNDIAATDIVSSGAITTLTGSVVSVDLVDVLTTYTGNTLQTGDSFALIGTAGAGLTNLGASGNDWNTVVPDAAGVAPTTAEIATGIWQDTTAGDFTLASSIGLSVMNGISLGTGLTIVSVSGSVGSLTGHTNQTADNDILAAGATGFTAIDTVVDAIKVATDKLTFTVANVLDANVLRIDGDATAGSNLSTGSLGMVVGLAETGTLSTTVMTTNLSQATDDHYNGGTLVFVGGVLDGQRTSISDYSGTAGTLTFVAITEAPVNGQKFIIV